MMTILIFVIPKKLKIDKMDKSICEKKLGDDEKKTVKLILNPFYLYHYKVRQKLIDLFNAYEINILSLRGGIYVY